MVKIEQRSTFTKMFLEVLRRLLILLLATGEIVSAVAVTGALGGVNVVTGQRPSRQEISTFQTSGGPAFDLYILAFQRFVQANQTYLLSYYQVAGE